jgi:hypothetical protein
MEITRGPKKHTLLLYYGETQNLKWDPAKYTWPTQVPPHDFHKGANQPLQGQNPQQATPVSFLIYTATLGCERRVKKETGLLWLIWHRAPVVNKWCHRISNNIDSSCPVCKRGDMESVLYRFWE